MNENKNFTPGPWKVIASTVIVTDDNRKRLIGSVFENLDIFYEARANARLMAAAPDLLAICKRIAKLAHPSREGFDSASNLLYADDLAQELLKVINKAEVES